MGQYYKPLNMDLKESLNPHGLDCGVKMGEILWSCHRVCDAMTILLTHNEGGSTRPGDLHLDGVTGRWAGKSSFYVGDYAEDGDMPNWNWPIAESDVYRAGEEDEDEGEKSDWTDVTDLVKPIIERSSHCLYASKHWGAGLVEVEANAKGGYDVAIPPDANQYLRQTLQTAQAEVAGRRGVEFLTDEQRADGQTRLIVNLDKLEFIDPAAFGETPTLAGMLKGMLDVYDSTQWSSIQALNATLFFGMRRGGGDAEGDLVGPWRGDRIVVLGDDATKDYPTQDEIRSSYHDISAFARDNKPR